MNQFDRDCIQNHFSKAAFTYDSAITIQKEMIRLLVEKCKAHIHQPDRIIDIGCGTGNALPFLKTAFPSAMIWGIDMALPMLRVANAKMKEWKPICADMDALPFEDNHIQMIFSSATLQWSQDIKHTFKEWYRVLKANGSLYVATFGPQTLKELRQAFQQNASEIHPSVHTFSSTDALKATLTETSFKNIQLETRIITEFFPSVPSILMSLKKMGATNSHSNRSTHLMGKKAFKNMVETYEMKRCSRGLPVTWEINLISAQK